MYYHISITNNFLFIDCHAKFEVITFSAHFYHNVPKMYCVMKIWFAGIRHWNKSRHKTILLLQNCDENVKSAKKYENFEFNKYCWKINMSLIFTWTYWNVHFYYICLQPIWYSNLCEWWFCFNQMKQNHANMEKIWVPYR